MIRRDGRRGIMFALAVTCLGRGRRVILGGVRSDD